jgi:molybdate transport system substrate-binding protein
MRARRRPSGALLATVAIAGAVAAACGSDGTSGDASGEVVVFAAASLTDAFTELGEAFTASDRGASVTFNFAASSNLVAQVLEGAPVDVVAAADLDSMARLTDGGAAAAPPVTFAGNRVEIVVASGNPLGIDGVEDLADEDLILVVCAPEVPCGSYANQVFRNGGIEPAADSYEENVRAVLGKVTLGEADAGIVYATDVIAAGDDAAGVAIPADLNVVAAYPIAVTTDAPNAAGARAFVEFVLGAEGQAILARYGFSPP